MGAPYAARQNRPVAGAGEGNRTLVISLEGFCSTIELHPHSLPSPHHRPQRLPSTPCPGCESAINAGWRGKDSNLRRHGRQIYSLLPLTAREPLRTKSVILARNSLTVKQFH